MFVFATLLICSVLQPSPQEGVVPSDARAAIAAANAEWLPSLKNGDVERIAAPYAVDGLFITATGTIVTGRDGIAQLMRDRIAQTGKIISGDLMQDGVTRQGSLIYEWGHANVQVAREGAAPTQSTGRYLTVWHQNAAGRWEIIRNLSLPD